MEAAAGTAPTRSENSGAQAVRTPSDIAPWLHERTDFVELDDVSRGVGDEGLAVGPYGDGIPDGDAVRAQLHHHLVEVGDLNREVLTDIRRQRGLEEMDLLGPEVDPSACDTEVGTVVAQPPPEYVGIEGDRLVDVTDIHGNVVDGKGLHDDKSMETALAESRLPRSHLEKPLDRFPRI